MRASIFKGAGLGVLTGLGIALTYMTASHGLPPKLGIWAGYIICGSLIGLLLSVCNGVVSRLFDGVLARFSKLILLRLLVSCFLGVALFCVLDIIISVLTAGHVNRERLLFNSLGVGIVSALISFILIYIRQKDEKIRLERENRILAVMEERNRIARELHDSVSQNLFGLNLTLNTLRYWLGRDPDKSLELIEQMAGMVEEVQTEMRLMIYELRPAALTEKGFFEAVDSLIRLFRSRYGLNIDWRAAGDESILDSRTQTALYRVLQESLHNVVQHARASKVTVALKVRDDQGELAIEDDGRGFLPDEVGDKRFGVQGMRERVGQIEGTLSINSSPGRGTTVTVGFKPMA